MPRLATPSPHTAPEPGSRVPAPAQPRRAPACLFALLAALGLATASPSLAAEGTKPEPSAYCPLPEPGQTPACLDPAKKSYGEFFEALDAGDVRDGPLAGVEAAVARGAAADPEYLALTSLTYGYYRLARTAAAAEDADPVIVERLSRWNALLASAYRENPTDTASQASVERAARELAHATPASLGCALLRAPSTLAAARSRRRKA